MRKLSQLQARVGVRAGLHERQAAVAVGERLLGAGDALLHPGRLLQRPVERERDPLTADVDALVPARDLAAQRLVVQLGVAGRHVDRGVVEQLLDHRQRHAVVDHAGAEVVAEGVGVDPGREVPVAAANVGLADVAAQELVHGAGGDVEASSLAHAGRAAGGRRGSSQSVPSGYRRRKWASWRWSCAASAGPIGITASRLSLTL